MAAERNFWQVLILASNDGVHMRVLEYPTPELAEEVITAVAAANETLNETFLKAFRLYPAPENNA